MLSRLTSRLVRPAAARVARPAVQLQARNMGGGAKYNSRFTVQEPSAMHVNMGLGAQVIMWLWVFHRFREDGAWQLLGKDQLPNYP